MYEYSVSEIVKIIDGDTVRVRIDLGFKIVIEQTLRLYGINAPERRGKHLTKADRERAALATSTLASWLEEYAPITVHTVKDKTGKYGRYLAVLYGTAEGGRQINLNDCLVECGHASPS